MIVNSNEKTNTKFNYIDIDGNAIQFAVLNFYIEMRIDPFSEDSADRKWLADK